MTETVSCLTSALSTSVWVYFVLKLGFSHVLLFISFIFPNEMSSKLNKFPEPVGWRSLLSSDCQSLE